MEIIGYVGRVVVIAICASGNYRFNQGRQVRGLSWLDIMYYLSFITFKR